MECKRRFLTFLNTQTNAIKKFLTIVLFPKERVASCINEERHQNESIFVKTCLFTLLSAQIISYNQNFHVQSPLVIVYLVIVESLDIVDKTWETKFLLNKFSPNSGF